MNCLVIGLGSMGKRRIRCLKALGLNNILGFDIRLDRRTEAIEKYDIEIVEDYASLDLKKLDLIIVSTPPDKHFAFTVDAIKNKIPCFVEASVSLDDVKKTIEIANTNSSFVAPSCTLKFHPIIEKIKEIVVTEKYGTVTNFSYHCGQYLPDWHPWESVQEFYVSNRETGGAREIVPFELTWLTDIFGLPQKVKGFYAKTMQIGANIEDTYAFSLKFDDFIGSMVVDVVSRYATRSLLAHNPHNRTLTPETCHKIRSATKFDPSGTISQLGERWVDTLVTDDTVVDVSSGSGSVAVSLLSGKVEIYAVDEGGALRRTSSYQSTGWVDDTRLTGTALHVVYSSGLVDIVDLTEPARPRRAELTNEGTVSVTRRHGDDFTVTRSPLGGLEVFDLAPEEAE